MTRSHTPFGIRKQHPWPNKQHLPLGKRVLSTSAAAKRSQKEEGGQKNSTLNANPLKKEIEFLCLEMFNLSQPPPFQTRPAWVGGLVSAPPLPPN